MGADCCDHRDLPDPHRGNPAYRRVLWAVLAINAVMFVVEIGAGLAAGSAALQADALDFLGDAANYGISLFVVGMALRYRATAALAKGGTMGLFGLWVIGTVLWHATHGTLPSAVTMGAVGFAALAANAASFGLLWAYRGGDANMRSAWICTGSGWCVRQRHGVARHHSRRDHGGPCAARRVDCGLAVPRRTTPGASGFGVSIVLSARQLKHCIISPLAYRCCRWWLDATKHVELELRDLVGSKN